MRKMPVLLSAIPRYKYFRYMVSAALLLSPILYLALWDTVIRYDLFSMMKQPFRFLSNTLTGEMARVQVSARPEVVLWRGGWMPAYWSKLGDLTPYHGVFSLAYLFYLGSSIYKQGIKRIGIRTSVRNSIRSPKTTQRAQQGMKRVEVGTSVRNSIKSPETIQKFWIVFGVIAFLTTSLSTVAILAELFSLIYLLIYIVALPLVPLSSYLWWKRRKTREKSVNEII